LNAVVHLVRHGHHALIGHVLCGRMPNVNLDCQGVEQMRDLARKMRKAGITKIQTSPLSRARQSAEVMAGELGLRVEPADAADELDYGAWTGKSFSQLESDPEWQRWNEQRNSTQPPRGESMQRLQRRIVWHVNDLLTSYQDSVTVVVSHAEPIRAALLGFLGISLDRYAEMQIDSGSVSTIENDRGRLRVRWVNSRGLP